MKYLFLISCFLLFSGCENDGCQKLEIIRIGGCNSSGLCAVMLSNGKKTHKMFPIVGERIKVCE